MSKTIASHVPVSKFTISQPSLAFPLRKFIFVNVHVKGRNIDIYFADESDIYQIITVTVSLKFKHNNQWGEEVVS